MKTPSQKFRARLPWFAAASLGALLSAGVLYSPTRSHPPGTPDKEARPSSPDQASNLNDQTHLAVTVYNSNIPPAPHLPPPPLPPPPFPPHLLHLTATANT